MEPELLKILRESVETKQRKEDLDRSIGRTLRRHNKEFELYVKMTSELRELARKKECSIDDAAAEILAKHQDDAGKDYEYRDSDD